MDALSIPQSFVLLVTEADGRRSADANAYDIGIAGAVLADLAVQGSVSLESRKVTIVRGATPPTDTVLSGALGMIAAEPKPRSAEWWIGKLRGSELRGAVVQSLVAAGLLGEQQRKVLGLFPTTSYPEVDGTPESSLRTALTAVLAGETTPTPGLAALVSLLHATGTIRKQFGHVPHATLTSIEEGDWAGPATRSVLGAIRAVAGATVAATAAAAAAGA